MDENSNNVVNDPKAKIMGFFNKNKNALIGLVVIIIAIILIMTLFTGGEKRVVKKFISSMNNGKISKAFDCVDMAGMTVLAGLDDDDYDDFWDEYKDFKDSDEYEEIKEKLDSDEYEDFIEELEDDYDDLDKEEKGSIRVKSFKKSKKEGKNLWKVRAKIETVTYDEDDEKDKDTSTVTFYVAKVGTKYKIVGGGSGMIPGGF